MMFTVIPHCIADIILGCDFLSSTGTIIDWGNHELHLSKSDVEHSMVLNTSRVLLCAVDHHMLSPQFTVAVTLSTNIRWTHPWGFLEPLPDVFMKKCLVMPNSLVDTSGDGISV